MSTPAVMFPIGEDRYAVATLAVREVVSAPRATRLPTAPPVLLGAFNLRGEVIPMFDTAALLGIGSITDGPVAVVVDTTAGPAALLASGLPKFVVLDEPVALSALPASRGVHTVDDGLVVLLDVEELLVPHGEPAVSQLADALQAP